MIWRFEGDGATFNEGPVSLFICDRVFNPGVAHLTSLAMKASREQANNLL